MTETAIISLTTVMCTAMLVVAAFRAWQGWLVLREQELATQLETMQGRTRYDEPSSLSRFAAIDGMDSSVAAQIEISDLRERVRRLEAIANGVDL